MADSDTELVNLELADTCICPFHDIFAPTPYCLLACTKCSSDRALQDSTHYLVYGCYNYCRCYKTCISECMRCIAHKDNCTAALD